MVEQPSDMAVKTHRLEIARTMHGWTVQNMGGVRRLGPYADKEEAVRMALALARSSRPKSVRLLNSESGCCVECSYEREGMTMPL